LPAKRAATSRTAKPDAARIDDNLTIYIAPPLDRINLTIAIAMRDAAISRRRMHWFLPNPGGVNRAFSLDALVFAYRELRLALNSAKAALQVSSDMMR